jgi:hypothetical protein
VLSVALESKDFCNGNLTRIEAVGKIRLERSNRQSYRPSGTDPLEATLPRHFVPGYQQLRQTTFLGWRDDKKPKDVVLE